MRREYRGRSDAAREALLDIVGRNSILKGQQAFHGISGTWRPGLGIHPISSYGRYNSRSGKSRSAQALFAGGPRPDQGSFARHVAHFAH
jgi:hypothetical protein